MAVILFCKFYAHKVLGKIVSLRIPKKMKIVCVSLVFVGFIVILCDSKGILNMPYGWSISFITIRLKIEEKKSEITIKLGISKKLSVCLLDCKHVGINC